MNLGGQHPSWMRQGSGDSDPLLLNGQLPLPVATARPILLTATERNRLKTATYGHSTPHQDRPRTGAPSRRCGS